MLVDPIENFSKVFLTLAGLIAACVSVFEKYDQVEELGAPPGPQSIYVLGRLPRPCNQAR
jgi:hypothetical protein